MNHLRRAAATTLVAFLLLASGAVAGVTPSASAGPLAQSTWCQHRDSMAIFGGSSATGYHTTGYAKTDGTYDKDAKYGWWKRVTDWADRVYGTADDGQPLQVNNYARNGASFGSYMPGGQWDITRNALGEIGENQPDLLILALGANEYLAQVSPDTMETHMRWVVDQVKTVSPRTAMLAIVQQNAYAGPSPVYPWELYKQRIMEVVVDEVLAMADVRADIPSAYAADWAVYYQTDRIHMRDLAQGTFGAVVRQWLFFC